MTYTVYGFLVRRPQNVTFVWEFWVLLFKEGNFILVTSIYCTSHFLQKVRVQETRATTTVTTPTIRTTRRPVTTAAPAPLRPGTRSAPAPGKRTGWCLPAPPDRTRYLPGRTLHPPSRLEQQNPGYISTTPGIQRQVRKKWNRTRNNAKQECIPVGYVPAARRPYAGVCFGGGGVCFPGEGVSASGGVWSWGGGLVRGGGVCSRGWGSGGIPACTDAEPRSLWTEWQTGVKILPWPKLRCGR